MSKFAVFRFFGSPSTADLQLGDLLFSSSNGTSITHIGFYAGNGKVFHAIGSGIRGDNGKTDIAFTSLNWTGFSRFDAIRLNGAGAGALSSGTGSTILTGQSVGIPAFTGGKGRFHLEGDGIPASEDIDVQAQYVAKLLTEEAPSQFAIDVVFTSGQDPFLDESLAASEAEIREGWIKAIAGLPIASMDESKAGMVYDAAKRWAMGDVTSAGAGAGETCTVTTWDTGILDGTHEADLEVAFADQSIAPSQDTLNTIKTILDDTHETLPIMRQKAS